MIVRGSSFFSLLLLLMQLHFNPTTSLQVPVASTSANGRTCGYLSPRGLGVAISTSLNVEKFDHTKRAAASLSSLLLSLAILSASPVPSAAVASDLLSPKDLSAPMEGISAVTQSGLGKFVRRSIVGGAQLADKVDLKWERFSDSMRDQKKCDPTTNRRLFDNGTRRDGTKIGNPVLGALCDPVPLASLDATDKGAANVVLRLAEEAASDVFGKEPALLRKKVEEVKQLVGPSFSRAAASKENDAISLEQAKRQAYNMDVYTGMRAYGEVLSSQTKQKQLSTDNTGGSDSSGPPPKTLRETARKFDDSWGSKMMQSLAPNASRKDFKSPFPPPDPADAINYDKDALLDALGAISVTLNKMQEGGLIGHWEISIPEDDYGSVVTIAVDDDISIGAQILTQEQNLPLRGSSVVALVRSAMDDRVKITYNLDTFFIDPSTTKQEDYSPTQLLVSISDLGV